VRYQALAIPEDYIGILPAYKHLKSNFLNTSS